MKSIFGWGRTSGIRWLGAYSLQDLLIDTHFNISHWTSWAAISNVRRKIANGRWATHRLFIFFERLHQTSIDGLHQHSLNLMIESPTQLNENGWTLTMTASHITPNGRLHGRMSIAPHHQILGTTLLQLSGFVYSGIWSFVQGDTISYCLFSRSTNCFGLWSKLQKAHCCRYSHNPPHRSPPASPVESGWAHTACTQNQFLRNGAHSNTRECSHSAISERIYAETGKPCEHRLCRPDDAKARGNAEVIPPPPTNTTEMKIKTNQFWIKIMLDSSARQSFYFWNHSENVSPQRSVNLFQVFNLENIRMSHRHQHIRRSQALSSSESSAVDFFIRFHLWTAPCWLSLSLWVAQLLL